MTQLADLMESIGSTRVQYIRCIKPNKNKSNAGMEPWMVVEQLRCAGMYLDNLSWDVSGGAFLSYLALEEPTALRSLYATLSLSICLVRLCCCSRRLLDRCDRSHPNFSSSLSQPYATSWSVTTFSDFSSIPVMSKYTEKQCRGKKTHNTHTVSALCRCATTVPYL